jgi:hypothetical protein
MASFQASSPIISAHRRANDHGLFSLTFSRITTAVQMTNLIISLMKTAVEVK